jgi:hypothetical protein
LFSAQIWEETPAPLPAEGYKLFVEKLMGEGHFWARN